MAFRLALVLLMVAVAALSTAASPAGNDTYLEFTDGMVDDVIDSMDQEMLMESESARRQLRGARGHIGYGALARNRVPCNQRGRSYYNCRGHQRANPYKRGCTRATRCARRNR